MKKNIFQNFIASPTAIKKYFLLSIGLLLTLSSSAHSNVKEENYNTLSLFGNPLFLFMLSVVVLLIIIIAVLSDVLGKVGEATKNRNSTKSSSTKIISAIVVLSLLANKKGYSQDLFYTATTSDTYGGISSGVFWLMLFIIGFELIIIAVLIGSIKLLAKTEKEEIKVVVEEEPVSLLEKLNASIPIENEKDIMFDHEYDGIRELDNDLPPWWKYGFYATIIFAFLYLVHYHVTETGDLQLAEYNKSVELAHEEIEAYQKTMADNVTENNVKMILDAHELEEGAALFKKNCAACHGDLGQGDVGPNLTDNYWLHGGSLKEIFTTIKYGWPDKGMKSWQADLSPSKMNEVASYIKTLVGTNPPNAKGPQGELYSEKGVANDSVSSDSTKIDLPKVDSTKIENK